MILAGQLDLKRYMLTSIESDTVTAGEWLEVYGCCMNALTEVSRVRHALCHRSLL